MKARRRHLVALVAFLGLLGCSDDDGGDDTSAAARILAAAPGKTTEEGSSRITLNAAVQGQTRGTFDGAGEFEFETEQGRLEVDLAPLGLVGEGRTAVLFDRDVVYLNLGGQLPGLGDRPWVKIDLDAVAGGRGDSIEALRQLQANDPTAVLNYLRGVTGKVTEVGPAEVRGTKTMHYKASVDLDKASKASPSEVRDDLAEVIRQLGGTRLPVEAWIDADGRLRRLRYTIDLAELSDDAPAKGSGTGKVTASLELFDFGVEVAVVTPPPAETTDVAKLLGG
jgi:hypothetical protein